MAFRAKNGRVAGFVIAAMCIGISWAPVFAEDPPAESTPADESAQTETTTESDAEYNEAREEAIPVFNEGVTALEAEDMPTALEHFRRASEIDPDFAEASKAMAAVAMELEEYQAAAYAAENLVRLEPDNVDAIGTAYFAELLLGDIERLIPSARRLADANPDVVSREMLQHAGVLFDEDLLEGSKSLLEVVLEKEPDLAPAHFQLGLTCNSMGDVECAKGAFQRFLELAPDGADAATAKSLLEYLE